MVLDKNVQWALKSGLFPLLHWSTSTSDPKDPDGAISGARTLEAKETKGN